LVQIECCEQWAVELGPFVAIIGLIPVPGTFTSSDH